MKNKLIATLLLLLLVGGLNYTNAQPYENSITERFVGTIEVDGKRPELAIACFRTRGGSDGMFMFGIHNVDVQDLKYVWVNTEHTSRELAEVIIQHPAQNFAYFLFDVRKVIDAHLLYVQVGLETHTFELDKFKDRFELLIKTSVCTLK